jgi:putative ABC transport system substrate-binding protein
MPVGRANRRAFIAALGGAAAWPVVARAQQTERKDRVRRIGVLLGPVEQHDTEAQARVAAFREGLEVAGWHEGDNIHIDYRFGGGDADRIRAHATELVNSAPELIVANSSAVLAELKRATRAIPLVFCPG